MFNIKTATEHHGTQWLTCRSWTIHIRTHAFLLFWRLADFHRRFVFLTTPTVVPGRNHVHAWTQSRRAHKIRPKEGFPPKASISLSTATISNMCIKTGTHPGADNTLRDQWDNLLHRPKTPSFILSAIKKINNIKFVFFIGWIPSAPSWMA